MGVAYLFWFGCSAPVFCDSGGVMPSRFQGRIEGASSWDSYESDSRDDSMAASRPEFGPASGVVEVSEAQVVLEYTDRDGTTWRVTYAVGEKRYEYWGRTDTNK